jgi:hypothetical protein
MNSVCCENLKSYECTLHKMVYLLQTENFSWKYFIKIHLLRMVLLDTQRKGKLKLIHTNKQTDTHTYALYETHPTFKNIVPLLCALQYSWASTYQFMTLKMLLHCIHSIYNFKKPFRKLLLKMAVFL